MRSVVHAVARARGAAAAAAFAAAICASAPARAEVPVQRTFFRLASSNGHGAVLVDLEKARLTHFREHLFATEEPLLDAAGAEIWNGNQPAVVRTRDLLYDAYFGLRVDGEQAWLTALPVDLDASGYAGWAAGTQGGTGVVSMVQHAGGLETTQLTFAPQALGHAGFVMALRVRNVGSAPKTAVQAFSLHNFHMGFGRPGVLADLGEQGETVTFDAAGGHADFVERAFAGVVVARALGDIAHHGASNAASPQGENVFAIVDAGGASDLPDVEGESQTGDGWVTAYQFDLGDLAPGDEAWAGVVVAHHGDPFGGDVVRGWLDDYVSSASAEELVASELASWGAFQAGLSLPEGLGEGEEALARHSAAVLRMSQVREETSYLREWLTTDGEPRYTRFGVSPDAPPAKLPATVHHRGKGAVLASLPPGEWTYAWARDGAYAAVAMAALGMKDEARDALAYVLQAEAGRFQDWNELASYDMPPYQVTLTRYHGFGVEETDWNDWGPNLELDGFGLFLWALRSYETLTGDTSLADGSFPVVTAEIADVLVALQDPDTGLVRRDSSIWESHWNGRERYWTYTSVTAVRGLCDAADIAERHGEADRANGYRAAAQSIRTAIAARLTDPSGALASNKEELDSGTGYWDAAVLDAFALGLFDPEGGIAAATLAGLDAHLAAPAGAGWSRNDDFSDHAGAADLSPWGSDYDRAEWVITDLRGAIATRLAGDVERSDRLLRWVRDQSLANYLAVAETYDEGTGVYKFNAPMAGFGAGAYALALLHAAGGLAVSPACGAYFDEGGGSGGGGGAGGTGGSGTGGAPSSTGSGGAGLSGASPAAAPGGAEEGCGCRTAPGAPPGPFPRGTWLVSALAIAARLAAAASRRSARPISSR